MIAEQFEEVYTKFKLMFYRQIFMDMQEGTDALTAVETFCMETIGFLRTPTVNEFANFMRISSPNAAYKVNSLLKKGFLEKIQSESDRREFHLQPTEQYRTFRQDRLAYSQSVMQRIEERFSPEDCAKLTEMLRVISEELMPEADLPPRE